MIIVKLGGGLGNQLYHYAFGRFLSVKHNTELKLDINNLKNYSQTNETHNRYRLGAFNIIENFASEEEVVEIISGKNKMFQVVSDGFGTGGGGGNRIILNCPIMSIWRVLGTTKDIRRELKIFFKKNLL